MMIEVFYLFAQQIETSELKKTLLRNRKNSIQKMNAQNPQHMQSLH